MKMRRADRQVTDPDRIKQILERGEIVHLAMNAGPAPYVVPLHYAFVFEEDHLRLYMHSAREGRKLDLIKADPHVFIEIDTNDGVVSGGEIPCAYGAAFSCVMGEGLATIVQDGAEKSEALQILLKQQAGRDFTITPEKSASVAVIRVDVPILSAKQRCRP